MSSAPYPENILFEIDSFRPERQVDLPVVQTPVRTSLSEFLDLQIKRYVIDSDFGLPHTEFAFDELSSKRATERPELTIDMASALHKFFVLNGDVERVKDAYIFEVAGLDLGEVYTETRQYLETGFGISDKISTKLPTREYVAAIAARKKRWSLDYIGLRATSYLLLKKRKAELIDENAKTKEVILINREIAKYPPTVLADFSHATTTNLA